ncbi:MAG TPA: hypothetical protein VFH68_25385 [Polyangia bacterium]|nr:hypothetical protein [Polyangia bacterium]
MVLWDVVEEHLGEAGFQWQQWQRGLASPRLDVYRLAAGSEAALGAHLDGLGVAGDAAVTRLLAPALTEGDPEIAAAAATVLLARSDGVDRVAGALRAAREPGRRHALTRAVALSRHPDRERHLLPWLAEAQPHLAAAALEALARRRLDPGPLIRPALKSDDPWVVIAALRAARFSDQPVAAVVDEMIQTREPAVRDRALETSLRRGGRAAFLACRRLVEARDPTAAFPLAVLAIGGEAEDLARIEGCLHEAALRPAAVRALGYAGRSGAIDGLLDAGADARIARLVGEAFAAITGIPIAGPLAAPIPGAGDEPDQLAAPVGEDLGVDLSAGPESELPVPDLPALADRWRSARASLAPSMRWLGGRHFGREALLGSLDRAPMRRRPLLVLELEIRSQGRWMIDAGDWAREQIRAARQPQAARAGDTAFAESWKD